MTLRSVLLAGALAASAAVGAAQDVAWEPLPRATSASQRYGLVEFVPAPDGRGTVAGHDLITNQGDFLRYAPGRKDHYYGDWQLLGYDWARVGLQSTSGAVFGSGGATFRSADGGDQSWVKAFELSTDVFLQSTLPGLPGAIVGVFTGRLCLSLDDGRQGTWTCRGYPGHTYALAEAPPSGALPQGRLLAGVDFGVAFSDDLGETWRVATSAEWGVGVSFAFVPEAGHPYGGALLAGLADLRTDDLDRRAVVARSDDGGLTWAVVWRYDPDVWGEGIGTTPHLFEGPDGAVWMSVYRRSGPGPYPSRLLRSTDAGVTWAAADSGLVVDGRDGPAVEVLALTAGPDGRIYLGTGWGVWRTTAPVYAVAGEGTPRPGTPLAVSVRPNPTGGAVMVALALAAPEAVRIAVYDARGREVLTVHQGAASDGQRFALDTSGLAPGAYVVRATAASGAASAGLTVVR